AKDRENARQIIGQERFIEVFLDVPLAVCEARDPKGLYAKARRGEIPDFTGVSSPYEAPEDPELRLSRANESVETTVDKIVRYMRDKGVFE
ncbi:MAG: adenylyl-sulfate kinase, partial [Armatimonadota bacterium]